MYRKLILLPFQKNARNLIFPQVSFSKILFIFVLFISLCVILLFLTTFDFDFAFFEKIINIIFFFHRKIFLLFFVVVSFIHCLRNISICKWHVWIWISNIEKRIDFFSVINLLFCFGLFCFVILCFFLFLFFWFSFFFLLISI